LGLKGLVVVVVVVLVVVVVVGIVSNFFPENLTELYKV
jgi:hypothetical protein